MIQNINEFLGTVAHTDLGKAARRSARTIWHAHRVAFETTRHEAGKVFGIALDQSQKLNQKLNARSRNTMDNVVENLAGAADEQISTLEQALQQGMNRVIHRIGLPTAKDVNALSRRVDALSAKVKVRSPKKATRRSSRRAA
ncbi:MAG: phasin family protein [Steroidobacteraceae bacterium]